MDDHGADFLLYRDETFRIRGAMLEVHNRMGCGFLEAVYQECLAMEFQRQGVVFEPQKGLTLSYRGVALRQGYAADFVCFDQIIVELKAVRAIAPEHRAQVLNYLAASQLRVALLANFGATSLQVERFAL